MKKQVISNKTKKVLPGNLRQIECPKCHDKSLYSPDNENINCEHCEGSWTKEAFVAVTAEG